MRRILLVGNDMISGYFETLKTNLEDRYFVKVVSHEDAVDELQDILADIVVVGNCDSDGSSKFMDKEMHVSLAQSNIRYIIGNQTIKDLKNVATKNVKIFGLGFIDRKLPWYIRMPFSEEEFVRIIS